MNRRHSPIDDAPPPALQVGEWRVAPELNQISRAGERVRVEPRAIELLVFLATQGAKPTTSGAAAYFASGRQAADVDRAANRSARRGRGTADRARLTVDLVNDLSKVSELWVVSGGDPDEATRRESKEATGPAAGRYVLAGRCNRMARRCDCISVCPIPTRVDNSGRSASSVR